MDGTAAIIVATRAITGIEVFIRMQNLLSSVHRSRSTSLVSKGSGGIVANAGERSGQTSCCITQFAAGDCSPGPNATILSGHEETARRAALRASVRRLRHHRIRAE